MNVVVTGGGTIAPIDDVRQITNVSSGRFSAMISESCLRRGETVWHVHAPSAVLPFARQAAFNLDASDPEVEFARLAALAREYRTIRDRLHLVPLRYATVSDYAATLERTVRDRGIDIAFLAMAVSDYEPQAVPGKLESDEERMLIHGHRSPKVIRKFRDWAPQAYLVGFKLLSRSTEAELIQKAEESNLVNRADLTVANDLQSLREGRHTVHLVRSDGHVETVGPSESLADQVVERVFRWAEARRRSGA